VTIRTYKLEKWL